MKILLASCEVGIPAIPPYMTGIFQTSSRFLERSFTTVD